MDQFRFKNYDNILTKVTISYFLVHDFYSCFVKFYFIMLLTVV